MKSPERKRHSIHLRSALPPVGANAIVSPSSSMSASPFMNHSRILHHASAMALTCFAGCCRRRLQTSPAHQGFEVKSQMPGEPTLVSAVPVALVGEQRESELEEGRDTELKGRGTAPTVSSRLARGEQS